jgi:hypothetical protein
MDDRLPERKARERRLRTHAAAGPLDQLELLQAIRCNLG